MELVRDIDTDRVKRLLVGGMVGVCREIGVEVLAEGIETRGEHEALLDLGVWLQQGYLMARPGFEKLPEVAWPGTGTRFRRRPDPSSNPSPLRGRAGMGVDATVVWLATPLATIPDRRRHHPHRAPPSGGVHAMAERAARPAASVSWKRTGRPRCDATTSSSRMTTRPRTTVAIGQPVTSMPSKGVQPERLAMSAWRRVRRAFRSTTVRSAS